MIGKDAISKTRSEQLASIGVSISNPEFCTRSKMGGFTDFYPLARSFL
jgi:hypothetical protein